MAYLSPRHLGTVKASLRFAKLLPATTTLIAYAQYDNLVVVDAYRTVTPSTTMCDVSAHNFWRPRRENDWWLGRWLVSTPLAPACMVPSCLPDQQGSWRGCWRTLTRCFFLNDSQHAEYFNLFCISPLESIYQWLISMDYRDIWYSTKMLQGLFSRFCGLYAFYFLAMCSRGGPLGIITGAFQ